MAKVVSESKQAKRERIRAECREFGIRPWEYHPEDVRFGPNPFENHKSWGGYASWIKAVEIKRQMRGTGLTFPELMERKRQEGAAP